jgi:starch-binding outer membrane protein, SusD/RagB family
MMKNLKLYRIIGIILLCVILAACSDSFLDTKPIAAASEESFYTTMTAAEMATTVCYSMFNTEKVWDLSILMAMGSISSDEAYAGGGDRTNVIEFQRIDLLTHTPQEANVFDWSWGYLYRAIGYCNVAIEKLPKISKETDPNFDAKVISQRLGEVRFIRALNYFTLCQMYGGVPNIDHVPGPSEYYTARSAMSVNYALIKSDLTIAINSLPERSEYDASNQGRVTKGAAKALLAKVYLYESSYAKNYPGDSRFGDMKVHWDSAAYWADEVINSNQYKLVGMNGERFNTWRGPNTSGYQWIFMQGANNSEEGVFEIQNVQDGKGSFETRGEGLVRWCAPAKVMLNSDPSKLVDYGWGWWSPSDFLVNSYEAGDPRYKATVIEQGDTVQNNIKLDGGVAWRKADFSIINSKTGTKRNSHKYECSYEEFWKNSLNWSDGPINMKIIRYADVVLFGAEAYFELGNQQKAKDYLNMVRTRARMSGNSGVPANLTGTITHENIEHERLVELACEGHRFFDLVRWKLASKFLNHNLGDGTPVEYVAGKHDFFPIPDAQITLSKGTLVQYEGW